MDQPCDKPRKGFFTKRLLLSFTGLAISTGALWAGKLGGENWVYALAVILAGHHASDIVDKWRH